MSEGTGVGDAWYREGDIRAERAMQGVFAVWIGSCMRQRAMQGVLRASKKGIEKTKKDHRICAVVFF